LLIQFSGVLISATRLLTEQLPDICHTFPTSDMTFPKAHAIYQGRRVMSPVTKTCSLNACVMRWLMPRGEECPALIDADMHEVIPQAFPFSCTKKCIQI